MTPSLQGYIGQPDQNLRAFKREVVRNVPLGQSKPAPPRGLQITNGALTWEAPSNSTGVTHFNVYSGDENNLVQQVNAKQTNVSTPLQGSTFIVTSYNSITGQESSPAVVTGSVTGADSSGTSYYIGVLVAGAYQPIASNGKYQQVTLSANATISAVVATLPSELTLILIQDATGGRTVTWDASYEGVGNFGVDQTPNTYSVFQFVLRGPDQIPILLGTPLTGVPWV